MLKDPKLVTEIDKDDVMNIFGNIEQVYSAHSAVVERIGEDFENSGASFDITSSALDFVFLSFFSILIFFKDSLLKSYVTFASNFVKTLQALDKCSRSKAFREFSKVKISQNFLIVFLLGLCTKIRCRYGFTHFIVAPLQTWQEIS